LAAALFAGGLLWAFCGREPVQEGRCRLVRRRADPTSQLMGLAFQFMEPLEDKPESVRNLPAGFRRPCYYEIRAKDRRVPLVVDLAGRPTLCIDSDGDGVLSEERCYTAESIEGTRVSSRSWRFGPISLLSAEDSRTADGRFYVSCYRTDTPAALTSFPASFRTGKLRLAGRTYRVALVDGDHDGLFNSVLSLPLDRPWRLPVCDVFAVDWNRNGTFETSTFKQSEVMPLGRLVRVGDVYYAIDIGSDGRTLKLSKAEPQCGTLTIEPNDAVVELRLWSDAADQHLLQSRERQLPAGKYKAIYAVVRKTDASGGVCTISSSLSSAFTHLGALEYFTIQPGETTTIRIGPPFVVKADVQKQASGTVSIGALLLGCAGERYDAPRRTFFKIVDEKGNVMAGDRFEYG